MKNPRIFLLACLLAAGTMGAASAYAWGDEGHEIIADIAYAYLKPAVRHTVDRLLADDGDALTAPDFESRATWADRYRDSDRFHAKTRYNGTHAWHFVDIEIGAPDLAAACYDSPALPAGVAASAGPARACVVDKIAQFAAELGDAATPRPEKILALKFLMHLVGDLHQPLHAADRNDRGGNDVPVLFARRTRPQTLHAYWDTTLVKRLGKQPRTIAAELRARTTRGERAQWARGDAAAWALESYALARDVAYDFDGVPTVEDADGEPAARLNAVYDARALPVVREQLAKAGVRLAAVLNHALD